MSQQVSEITDITDGTDISNIDEDFINPDEGSHFTRMENPQRLKCNHCHDMWKSLTTTTKKAHLSNIKYCREYKVKLCPQVSKPLSLLMVAKLDAVHAKAAKKRNYSDRVQEEMGFERDNLVVKKAKIINIADCFDTISKNYVLADQKIANYIYVTKQSFNSCDSLAYQEMVAAVLGAGVGYVPPTRQVIAGRLLDERFSIVQAADEARLDFFSKRGHGVTITSDASTIHKRPLTNYIACAPPEPPIFLHYADATALYQDDRVKNADEVFLGLVEAIEKVGPSNVTAVVLDNAEVMVAAMAMLSIRYVFLFCLGCLAHKVNTLVKHIISDNDMMEVSELVDKSKLIIQHFNSKHKPHAILQQHLQNHLKQKLAFIIPADTRFGLYLLSLHRLYRMKPGIQSAVLSKEHINFCESGTAHDDDVVRIVKDDLFWDEVLKLLTLLLPLLRLIRLAELNIQVIGKFYPAMLSIKSHLHAKHNLLPYGWKIRDKFISKAVVGEWLQDIHLAAYVLDPEYWDVDHLNMADAMQAFSDCIEKIFHFKKAPVDGWHSTLLCQLRTYKNKIGHFSKPCAARSAKNLQPTEFFETYGMATMELTFMARRIFRTSISNDAAELNWKHFKDNCTKARARLGSENVHKLISIQGAQLIRERGLHDFKVETAKWTLEDEICKLTAHLEFSREINVINFNNFKEDWEDDKINTKNKAHETLLNDKYQHIYLFDDDVGEIRRAVHVEWSTNRPTKYVVITQLVRRDGHDGIDDDEDLVSYYINDSLFDCIRAAPRPFNQERKLIERTE